MDSRSYRPEPQAIPDKTGRTVIVAIVAAVLGAILAGTAVFVWQQARVASLKSEVAAAKESAQTATAQLGALKTQLEEVTATAAKEEKKAEKEKKAAKEARQAEKAAAEEDLPDGKHYGTFKDVTTKPSEVSVDVQEYLTGDEAKKAAKEAGEEFVNDYFIVNVSTKLRDLPVKGDAEVNILTKGGGSSKTKTVTYEDFASMFSNPSKDEKHLTSAGYWFWLEKGEVVKIEEQFTP